MVINKFIVITEYVITVKKEKYSRNYDTSIQMNIQNYSNSFINSLHLSVTGTSFVFLTVVERDSI